jgi:hypothetical protein
MAMSAECMRRSVTLLIDLTFGHGKGNASSLYVSVSHVHPPYLGVGPLPHSNWHHFSAARVVFPYDHELVLCMVHCYWCWLGSAATHSAPVDQYL